MMKGGEALRRELTVLRDVEKTTRQQLYAIESAGVRATAVTALAASAAERAYRRSDALPELANETSGQWRRTLADVWAYLEGNERRHHELSRAIAAFLTSPMNHNEGQDGPDDFDRPQTIASYSAAASVIFWGVDFATTAIAQPFELIDLQFDGNMTPERSSQFERERESAQRASDLIVRAAVPGGSGFDRQLVAALRR